MLEIKQLTRLQIIKYCEKLEEENKKLKIIIENNDLEQKADWKHIEELEEENKKLRANYYNLSKIVEVSGGYKASYVNELRDKIAKLEFDLSKFKDSFKKYRDYEKEELAESCYDLARENEKLRDEVKDLVDRNIELDKKYMFVLRGNQKLK